MRTKNCVICNTEFKPKTTSKVCSEVCRREYYKKYKRKHYEKNYQDPSNENGKKSNCLICNREFLKYTKTSKYCREECRTVAIKKYSKQWRKENAETLAIKRSEYQKKHRGYITERKKKWRETRRPPKIDVQCKECKEYFTPKTRHKHHTFCSQSCRKSYWLREEAIQKYGKYSPKKKVSCIICEKVFMQKAWNQKTCSKECNVIMRKGYERKDKPYSSYSPLQKINARMRALLRSVLVRKGIKKTSKTYTLLGYTGEELIQHLESQFTNGMSWDNMNEWHIDHIRPVASFNYDSTDHPDFKKCWALNNLQPLWATDNIRKGDKWDGVVNA